MLTRTLPKLARVIGAAAVAAALVVTAMAGNPAQAQDSSNYWSDIQKSGKFKVCVAEAPPYLSRDAATGEWSGFFLEVARGFAESIEVEAEPVETTWGNMIAAVQSGKCDVASALNRRPKRALAVNYSIPIWFYEIGFLYNNENPKAKGATTLSDIDKAGVTVAVMQGAAGDLALTPVLKNAKIVRLPGSNEGRLAVISRQADYFATDSDTNRLTIRKNPEWATQILPEPAITKEGVAFGFSKAVSLADIQVFNIYLEAEVAKGAVQLLFDEAQEAMSSE